jgi:hypothetical protein
MYGDHVSLDRPRLAVAAVVLACAGVGGPVGALAAKNTVKAPKSGAYTGPTAQKRHVTISISGKTVQLVGFDFKCEGTDGATNLNDIKLKRTTKGYKFALKAHGSITFTDGQPDENGRVDVAGRFTRSGKRATGYFRVRSSRCHTGPVQWSARR